MDTDDTSAFLPNHQVRIVLAVLAGCVLLLMTGYFIFLRANFSVLYKDLRTEDAAAIVSELDAQDIRYKIRDGGRTILVPGGKVDEIRLAVIGSDLPLRGLVGFELFNESEMGLTDFAQQIKYQRALQGELARTIMLMEGIESARVHIAIPERTLFRAEASVPTAAVTIETSDDFVADDARIAGIQRLVAASVPDLSIPDVFVLSANGQVISDDSAAGTYVTETAETFTPSQPGETGEEGRKIRDILSELDQLPELEVTISFPAPLEEQSDGGHVLHVVVQSDDEVQPLDRARIESALASDLGLDFSEGDRVEFTTSSGVPSGKPTATMNVGRDSVLLAEEKIPEPDNQAPEEALPLGRINSLWPVLIGGVFLVCILIILRRNLSKAKDREHRILAENLRSQLMDRSLKADGA